MSIAGCEPLDLSKISAKPKESSGSRRRKTPPVTNKYIKSAMERQKQLDRL